MSAATLYTVRYTLTRNGGVASVLTGGARGPAGADASVASATHAATDKATPVDADEMPLSDSAASWGLKKLTWANLKATLKAYFDTVYQPLAAALSSWASVTRAAGFDTFAATPSSANLRSLLTDETGTGAAVFGTSPTISAPSLTGTTDISGGQLKFPATQSASSDPNTLDDYEEGTFTPTLLIAGAPSSGMVYTVQQARYTKVGNVVNFKATVAISAIGAGVGAVRIGSLPFTSEATANSLAPLSVYAQGLTGTSGGLMGYIDPSSTSALIRYSGTGSGTDLLSTNLTASSYFVISGHYFV